MQNAVFGSDLSESQGFIAQIDDMGSAIRRDEAKFLGKLGCLFEEGREAVRLAIP